MSLPVHERPRGSVADLISRFEPLKPHHTGQSATSEHSVRKSASTTTPSRPKTPTTIARPETPSGPPAPTAASLARARDPQPQLPVPMGEVRLGSSSADHLSNSTTASFNHAHHLHLSGSTEVGSHDRAGSGNEGAGGDSRTQGIQLASFASHSHSNSPHQRDSRRLTEEASDTTYGFETSETAFHASSPSSGSSDCDCYLQSPAIPRHIIASSTKSLPVQANQPFHALGWTKYLLPDENRYYMHHAYQAVTDVDLSDERLLERMTAYLADHDDVAVPGQELWLRDTDSHERGLAPLGCLVNHGEQSVTFNPIHESNGDGKPHRTQHGNGDDQLDARCRYWSFMEAHPVHVPLPPNAHQDAIDALDWVSTDWLFPSHRSIPAPFTREECQSLIALLQSFDKRREAGAQIPLHTHTVSRVLLEIVRWRQYHFRPNKPLPADAGRDGLCRRGHDRPARSSVLMLVIACLAASIALGPSITAVRGAGMGAVLLSLFLVVSNVMVATKCEGP